MIRRYVFGPVASRRLGISLGVDLTTPKICPQNCLYCEAGKTTLLTMERKEYVPVNQVLAELEWTLDQKPELDSITFSGSGEPTLNCRIGEVIHFLKSRYPAYRVTLLTNGMLLGDPAVQQEIREADWVIPSLDASNQEEFSQINRPEGLLSFAAFTEGLAAFTAQASMRVSLELFVLPEYNDSDASLERFASLIAKIAPDEVQLNRLDRPGTDAALASAPQETMERFQKRLSAIVPTVIVGQTRAAARNSQAALLGTTEMESALLALISRRPATAADAAAALAMPPKQAEALLRHLEQHGACRSEKRGSEFFYRLRDADRQ